MSKLDASSLTKTEFPVLDAQGSNYAGWLESFQASTRAKSHEHYQFSRFIEKPYLTKVTAGFKTLNAVEKKKANDQNASSSRTASAEPPRRVIQSKQSAS